MEEMSQGLESTMIAVLDQNVPDLHISQRLQGIPRRYCHLVAPLFLTHLLLGIWEPGVGLHRSQVFTCLGHTVHTFSHGQDWQTEILQFRNFFGRKRNCEVLLYNLQAQMFAYL